MPQQQRINPDPTQFDLDAVYADEDAGLLPPDMKQALEEWRASGVLPKRTPKIAPPPLGNADTGLASPKRIGRATLPTAGGIVGGAAAGMLTGGNPVAVRAGSGIGAGAGQFATDAIEQGTLTPKDALLPALGQAALGVALPTGRMTGRIMSGQGPFTRRSATPIGKETVELLGDKALPSDVVESPGLEFMRNVASEGSTGKEGMLAREIDSGNILKNKIVDEAKKTIGANAAPTALNSPALTSERTAVGTKVKDTLLKNYTADLNEARQLYNPFLQKFGQNPGELQGKQYTVSKLHELRREALLQGRRLQAAAQPDANAIMANKAYRHELEDALSDALGPAKREYDQISGQFREVMDKHENDFVHWLREGDSTPDEKILSIFENPAQLRTFAPERDITIKAGTGRNAQTLPAKRTISQEQAVHLFRDAVGEDAFKQFRADAIFHLAKDKSQKILGGTEALDGHATVEALKKIPPNVQDALYGPGAADRINKIARVTEHVQRPRSGAGGLWIVMRQGSAMTAPIQQTAGVLTGKGISGLAISSAGTILLLPKMFSAILRNPKSLELFTQAVGAKAPSIKQRLVQELTTQLVRTGAFIGAEDAAVGEEEQDQQAIPTPPAGVSIRQTPLNPLPTAPRLRGTPAWGNLSTPPTRVP